jgi:hypothetical protein
MAWMHGKLVLDTMKGLFLSDTNGSFKESSIPLPASVNTLQNAMPRHRNTLCTDATQNKLLYIIDSSVLLLEKDPVESGLRCMRHIDCGSTVLQANFVTDCNVSARMNDEEKRCARPVFA